MEHDPSARRRKVFWSGLGDLWRVSLAPWGNEDELDDRLKVSTAPTAIWLAASGPEPVMRRRLRPLEQRVRQAGYRCELRSADLANARVLLCSARET